MQISARTLGPLAHAPPVEVHVLREAAVWDRLGGEWDDLADASPSASPFLRLDWLREWWRLYGPVYGDDGGGLRVLTVRREGRLIGALPLYEARSAGVIPSSRLLFLSTGEAEWEETCPAPLDLLHAPGEGPACLAALRSVLLDEPEFQRSPLDLCALTEDSPLLASLAWLPQGYDATVWEDGVCPVADLSGGLDAYLSRLPYKQRKQPRSVLRKAARAGAAFEVASAADADSFFEQLVRLHQRRWTGVGRPGCFAAERFTTFHHRLVRSWVPAGHAVLARLSLEGEPLAVLYGFRRGPKFDLYQMGVALEQAGPLKSPGVVACLLLMDHLAERGVARFDFLRGLSPYKVRLATDSYPLVRLRLYRRTIAADASRALEALHQVARTALRRALNRPSP